MRTFRPAASFRVASPVVALVALTAALAAAACAADVTAVSEQDAGSDSDASVQDTGNQGKPDAGTDSGKGPTKDAAVDATTPVDAGPVGINYGKAAIDESCAIAGNFANSGDVQIAADGARIAYQHCDADKTAVIRDLATNLTSVLTKGAGFVLGGANGVLSTTPAGTTQRTSWDAATTVSLPTAITATDAWRVWHGPNEIRYATKTSSLANPLSKERMAFYASSNAAVVYSQEYDIVKTSIASVIFSQDGALAASLERYPSELKSRLRVANVADGAKVTTYELGMFEPRWVKEGVLGNGALLLSGMNGTQEASQLYYVNFTTGAVTQLSSTDVIPYKPPTSSDVPAVTIVNGLVYFMTGDVYDGSNTPGGKSVTIKKWNPTTPATAPEVVKTLTNTAMYYLAKYTSQKRSLVASADGTYLFLNLYGLVTPQLYSNNWMAVPVDGGPAKLAAVNSDVAFAPPSLVGSSNYQESDTKFLNVANGTTTSMTRGNPLFSKDGSTLFTSVAKFDSATNKSSLVINRLLPGGQSASIVNLAQLESLSTIETVQKSNILLRLPRNAAVNGQETKYDLYVFP